MPSYFYKNEVTGEVKEVIQRMSEPHEYSEDGVKFVRIFTIPQAVIDGKMDALSPRDFVEKTAKKKGTMGDLFDCSRELSEKRKQIIGKDPVKERHYENYAKKRKGKKHPDQLREETNDFTFNV